MRLIKQRLAQTMRYNHLNNISIKQLAQYHYIRQMNGWTLTPEIPGFQRVLPKGVGGGYPSIRHPVNDGP